MVTDPRELADELRRRSARTVGRAELEARHGALPRVSPRVGELDEAALTAYAREDPDAAISLLADLARATDREVRAAARRLARTIALRPPPAGSATPSGRPWLSTLDDPTAGDLDLDATMGRLDTTPRLRGSDVRVRDWSRRGAAYVVLIDASGSVAGPRLATAVLTAGAVATRMRAGDELAVLAFASDVLVLRRLDSSRPPGDALDGLLDVRGGGVTDLAHALRAALAEASRARSPRREVLLLSDGLPTSGADPLRVAAAASRAGARLHVLALADDGDSRAACVALAGAGGGRAARLLRPSQAPGAVEAVLGRG